MDTMNKKRITDHLHQKLTDAQDGLLSLDEQKLLEKQVKAHDPQLWEDHLWMMKQMPESGVFSHFAGMREEQPAEGAIRRFHKRREAEGGSHADLEFLVWSWFRRYVLTVGLVLIVIFTGLQWGTPEETHVDSRDQVAQFLGWDQDFLPELDHWLYEDLY